MSALRPFLKHPDRPPGTLQYSAGLDNELAAMLMTLSFFASMDAAEAFRAETGQKDLAAMATKVRGVFPDAVAEYARLGRTIQKVLLENQASEGRPRRSTRIGRNEPCRCGSGRKWSSPRYGTAGRQIGQRFGDR